MTFIKRIQDWPFRGCSRMGGTKSPLPKIWYSYILHKEDPTIMQITWHIPWVLLTSAFLHPKSAIFVISINTNVDCILMYNFSFFLLTFFESLKAVLINMVSIWTMSAKLATLGLLKVKIFWNKGYDVISYIYDVTKKILLSNSNYIVDVVKWPKFDISSISMRKVIITSILYGFGQKNQFFWGVLLIQAQ